MASLELVKQPVLFWPRSCLVNLNGLAKDAALFLALSFRLLLWNSALRKVKIRIALRSVRPALSTSPTYLYCLFSSLSSSLRILIFLALWLGAYGAGADLDASVPNRSAAMFTMRVVIVLSRWSTSPLAVTSRTWLTSSSNCCHSTLLEDLGHWILGWTEGAQTVVMTATCLLWKPCGLSRDAFSWVIAGELLAAGVGDTRRLWALWVASGPGSSCVLPEVISVRCVAVSSVKHLILP